MTVKPIAKSYWRLMKAGRRTFDSVPDGVKEDVKTMAREDVAHGIITEEQYKDFIGEAFAAE